MSPKIKVDTKKLQEKLKNIGAGAADISKKLRTTTLGALKVGGTKSLELSKRFGSGTLSTAKRIKTSIEEKLRRTAILIPALRDAYLPLDVGHEVPYLTPKIEITKEDIEEKVATTKERVGSVNKGHGVYLHAERFQNVTLGSGKFLWWNPHLEIYRKRLAQVDADSQNSTERKRRNVEVYKEIVLDSLKATYVSEDVEEVSKETNLPNGEVRKVLEKFSGKTKKPTISPIDWEKETKNAVIIEVSKKVVGKRKIGTMDTNVIESAVQVYDPYSGTKEFSEFKSISELEKELGLTPVKDTEKRTAQVLNALAEKHKGKTVHILCREDSNKAKTPRKLATLLGIQANRFFSSKKEIDAAQDITNYKAGYKRSLSLIKRIKKNFGPLVPEIKRFHRPIVYAALVAGYLGIGAYEVVTIRSHYKPTTPPTKAEQAMVAGVKGAVEKGKEITEQVKEKVKKVKKAVVRPRPKKKIIGATPKKWDWPGFVILNKPYDPVSRQIQVQFRAEDKYTSSKLIGAIDKVELYVTYNVLKKGKKVEKRKRIASKDFRGDAEKQNIEYILQGKLPELEVGETRYLVQLVVYDKEKNEAKYGWYLQRKKK